MGKWYDAEKLGNKMGKFPLVYANPYNEEQGLNIFQVGNALSFSISSSAYDIVFRSTAEYADSLWGLQSLLNDADKACKKVSRLAKA